MHGQTDGRTEQPTDRPTSRRDVGSNGVRTGGVKTTKATGLPREAKTRQDGESGARGPVERTRHRPDAMADGWVDAGCRNGQMKKGGGGGAAERSERARCRCPRSGTESPSRHVQRTPSATAGAAVGGRRLEDGQRRQRDGRCRPADRRCLSTVR